jgi:diguanylate cyclase (GGDEF)-like protein
MATLVGGASLERGFLDEPAFHDVSAVPATTLDETFEWMRSVSERRIGVPRRVAYPVLGASAALALSAGLVLVRLSPANLGWDSILAEILGNAPTYLYLGIVVMAAFIGLGAVWGYETDQLLAKATTDPLTGLHNRRALQQRIDEELARAARYGQRLSLLMIDLDKFKQVNDQYGHLAGDALLHGIGHAIQDALRTSDYAVRLGGDEFAIISPNADEGSAALLAARVSSAIARDARRQHQPVTASIGIASYNPRTAGAVDRVSLIKVADSALYEAKLSRGNSIRIASIGALVTSPARAHLPLRSRTLQR